MTECSRRQFLGTTLAAASIGRITSLKTPERPRLVVQVEDELSTAEFQTFAQQLKQFVNDYEVLIVQPGVQIDIVDDELQFIGIEATPQLRRWYIFDANDSEVQFVRWAHLPTGICCVIDRDLYTYRIVRHPGPLTYKMPTT